MNKNFFLAGILFLMSLTACKTYYVASTTAPTDLVVDSEVAYNVPTGSLLLLKGHDKNGYTKVRYHSNLKWYLASTSSLKLVDNLNPKYYADYYANYESNSSKLPSKYSNGYDASIQTGSRGGKYYINKNGKKTYVKRNTSSGSVKHIGGRGSRGGRH